jgi:hypothetical protein
MSAEDPEAVDHEQVLHDMSVRQSELESALAAVTAERNAVAKERDDYGKRPCAAAICASSSLPWQIFADGKITSLAVAVHTHLQWPSSMALMQS